MKIKILLFTLCMSLLSATTQANPVVLGDERISEQQYLKLIQGKNIGLLAHHASRNHQGEHVVDLIASLPGVKLKMIFAPEHGFRSVDDTLLPDSIDSNTGLPVYSLYGPRNAPTQDMLEQLDAVIIDLQDVGLRYYTYPATLFYTLQASAKAGKKVIVLDRPNPLGGELVEGAVLEKALVDLGLTTLAALPTRHGMTLGELAVYLNHELNVNADLTVVPMQGWYRSFTWDKTDLLWTPSSPALTSSEQVFLYAVLGTLESVKLAVGRGQNNDQAFRIYGAPYITAPEQKSMVDALQKLNLEGLDFYPYNWTPDRSTFQGEYCRGFGVRFTGEASFASANSFKSLVEVISVMKKVLKDKLALTTMADMIGATWIPKAFEAGMPVEQILSNTEADRNQFVKERESALLYPEHP